MFNINLDFNNKYCLATMDFTYIDFNMNLAKEILSKEELDYINKAVLQRKKEFCFGHLLAKYCYAILSNSDLPPNKIVINKGFNGAPYFNNSKYFLSISHDLNFVGAIVTNNDFLKVGIDIQSISNFSNDIIDLFANNNELNIVSCLDNGTAYIWAAKESLSKLFQWGFSIFNVLEIKSIYQSDKGIIFSWRNLDIFKTLVIKKENYLIAYSYCELTFS